MQSAVEAVTYMRGSPDDAAVQLEGLHYLADFSLSQENVLLAVAAGGIEAVIAAMKAHAGNAAVTGVRLRGAMHHRGFG